MMIPLGIEEHGPRGRPVRITLMGGLYVQKINCIRTNGVPNCNIDLAARVQTMICLGEASYRKGKMMHFDRKARTYWS